MKKNIFTLVILAFIVSACRKEVRISKALDGSFTFTEMTRKKTSILNTSKANIKLFFTYNKDAYTATLQGSYKIDSIDPSKRDLVGSFQYDLKNSEFNVQDFKLFPAPYFTVPTATKSIHENYFKNKRFVLKINKNNSIELTRKDSAEFYLITATKD